MCCAPDREQQAPGFVDRSGVAQWPGSSAVGRSDAAACGTTGRCLGWERSMISMAAGVGVLGGCGATDMRRGFDGLAMMVQDVLKKSPYCGHMFVFRRKRAD